jgi:hypothetical protein
MSTDKETVQNAPELPIKRAAIMLLADQGYKNGEIAKALSLHSTYPSIVKNKLKKYDIMSSKRVKTAVQVHDLMMDAVLNPDKLEQPLPFTLKASDVNTNIDRVLDRYQPKITKVESRNLNVDLQIDYSEFLKECK